MRPRARHRLRACLSAARTRRARALPAGRIPAGITASTNGRSGMAQRSAASASSRVAGRVAPPSIQPWTWSPDPPVVQSGDDAGRPRGRRLGEVGAGRRRAQSRPSSTSGAPAGTGGASQHSQRQLRPTLLLRAVMAVAPGVGRGGEVLHEVDRQPRGLPLVREPLGFLSRPARRGRAAGEFVGGSASGLP